MIEQLPLSEVLETAKQKLGSVSACLNDPAAFAAAVNAFDDWLSQHKELIARTTTDQSDCRQQIEHLIRALTRLEMQARYNISLVTDMQGYIRGELDTAPYRRRPITANCELTKTALLYDSEAQDFFRR